MKRTLLLLLLMCRICNFASAQGAPACPSVTPSAGSATICKGQCTTLSAAVVATKLTTGYSVSSIPYVPYPYAGTPILVGLDDVWSDVTKLGFNFCYFGNTYSRALIGANGQICFDTTLATGPDPYPITSALPNSNDLPGNTICAVFRDIDPALGGTIYFETVGSAPCRALVISWVNIPLYDKGKGTCDGTPNSTFQVVLYENTNFIDVYVQNSFSCSGWNGGNGIIGIQNALTTVAVVAPGRNYPAAWTATNEAWRFSPTGAPSYSISWTGPGGVIGSGASVSVCPTVSSTYTATLSVTNCNGVNTTYTGTVGVTVNPSPTLAITPVSPTICAGGSVNLTASGATSYTWSPATNLSATSGATVTANPSSSTTYTVTGNSGGCPGSTTVTVSPSPPVTPLITGPSTQCSGGSTTLTASGGSTYSWSTGATTASITVSPATNTTYTVTALNASGCSGTSTHLVTVNTNPVAGITGNSNLCAGATTTLTGSGGGTYSWSTGSTSASITVTPAATTTYTLTAATGAGCSATATQTVTINTNPVTAISGTSTICSGSSTLLNGSGGGTYSWSNGATTPAVTVSPTSTTTYTLTATNAAGCSTSATQTVTVNSNPVASITGSNAICNGASTKLTGSGGGTYSWNNGATTPAITISPTATTTYTLTTMNAAGCSASAMQTVAVNANPVASIAGTSILCNGSSTTLTGSGGGTYSWNNGASTSSITVSPAVATTYTLIVTNAAGCKASATETVTVNSNPVPLISGNAAVCIGSNMTLTGSGGGTYSWNTGATTSTISLTPAISTTYTLTVTAPTGCTAHTSLAVTVHALPVLSTSKTDANCGNTNGSATVAVTNGALPFSYSWSNGQTTPTATNLGPGTYQVLVTDSNSCQQTASVTVGNIGAPALTIQSVTSLACFGQCTGTATVAASGGSPGYTYLWSPTPGSGQGTPAVTQLCAGTYTVTVTDRAGCQTTQTLSLTTPPLLTASDVTASANCHLADGSMTVTPSGGTPGSGYTYAWSPAPATGQTGNTVTGLPGNVYQCIVTDSLGCSALVTDSVHRAGIPPVAFITGQTAICSGSSATLTASGGTSYLWSPGGATSSNIVVTHSGNYTVTVSNSCGSASASFLVNVQVVNAAFTSTVKSGYAPLPVTFTDHSNGSLISWSWTFGNGATATGQNTQVDYTSPGTYTVTETVTDSLGCSSQDTTVIIVHDLPSSVIVPNVFTPNGDGINDLFTITAIGLTQLEAIIYDRWGVQLAHLGAAGETWDGRTLAGEPVSDGTYFYQVNGTGADGKEYHLNGFIMLMR